MDVGFTGTRDGMSKPQLIRVAGLLYGVTSDKNGRRFHHGDCVGADDEAAWLANLVGFDVIGHPPINEKKRAFSAYTHIWRTAKDYFPRNFDIVDESQWLIATPKAYEPETHSGTWGTVQYAMGKKKMIYVVYPDGSMQTDWGRGELKWEGAF